MSARCSAETTNIIHRIRISLRRRAVLWGLAFSGVLLAGCAPTPVVDFSAAPQGTYQLDPKHASIIWRVGHLNGLSRFVGRFDDFDAALEFDPDAPEQARLSAVIEAASINTGLADFDPQIANNSKILDAQRHPQIRFETTAITLTGGENATVTGDLTVRGVTAPLTLDVRFNGTTRDFLRGGARVIGFSAIGTLSRSTFGADAYINFGVSDEVELLIEAEFIRQGS